MAQRDASAGQRVGSRGAVRLRGRVVLQQAREAGDDGHLYKADIDNTSPPSVSCFTRIRPSHHYSTALTDDA